jgi:hypothetical protein
LLLIVATTGKRDIHPRPMNGIRETWEECIHPLNNLKKNIPGKGVETYDD